MTDFTAKKIARVIVPIPVDEPFSYLIPEELDDLIVPGVQVIVPFGERYKGGIVTELGMQEEAPTYEIKYIHDVVNPRRFIQSDLLQLLHWISDYYVCNLGESFRLVNPEVNLSKANYEVQKLTDGTNEKVTPALNELLDALPGDEWTSLKKLEKKLNKNNLLYRIQRLKSLDLLNTRYVPPGAKKIYQIKESFQLLPNEGWHEDIRNKYLVQKHKRQENARALITYLESNGLTPKETLKEAGFSTALLRRLKEEGVIAVEETKAFRKQERRFKEGQKNITLNDSQNEFISKVEPFIDAADYRTFLLHGVTGSGKTQIYIELIRKVLAQGKQAIVLIPEIVLTPQTMARFYNYFQDDVAVIHSRISPGEKLEVLDKVRDGKFRIVIGPRSAIFAPFDNLGLIIVDEEHESSYKQSDMVPRYHARDVALYRAYLNKIPVVLGSATPGLETLHNAKTGKYEYYYLAERATERKMPRIQLVNFKEEWRKSGEFQLFSETMLLKLESRIVTKEQAMLLQNRRGFSPYIQCHECGHVESCPNCDITLTYHYVGKILRCHYCGYSQSAPDFCVKCKGFDILYKGVGTQKIEEDTRLHFPYARLLRMDQDTTRRKGEHSNILEKFRNYEADFLIGTKMIAKGLDFERVTLVAVMNADQGLQFPDFRSSEKVFQLLVQAAGRAGRGDYSGEVIIQTFDPEHFIFNFLMSHDYLGFYEREVETRKSLNYPPFSRLCLIRIIGDDEERVHHYGKEIVKYLWKGNKEKTFGVLGPAPAPLVKINNRYRYHILIKQGRDKDPSMSYVRGLLRKGLLHNSEIKKWPVDVQIDVDPVEIL